MDARNKVELKRDIKTTLNHYMDLILLNERLFGGVYISFSLKNDQLKICGAINLELAEICHVPLYGTTIQVSQECAEEVFSGLGIAILNERQFARNLYYAKKEGSPLLSKDHLRSVINGLIGKYKDILTASDKKFGGVFMEEHGTDEFVRVCSADDNDITTVFQVNHQGILTDEALIILKERLLDSGHTVLSESEFVKTFSDIRN